MDEKTDPGLGPRYSTDERLIRIETKMDAITAKLDTVVTQEQCDVRRPTPGEPAGVRLQRWLTIAALVAAMAAGYWQLQGMEARIVRVGAAQPKVIYSPTPVPYPVRMPAKKVTP